jgi:hypothetical protein
MNTKVVIVLQDLLQFKATNECLRLWRQIPNHIHVFVKPSPLGKRHTIVKVTWPINYWVVDKDTSVKVSPTLVQNMGSAINIGNTTTQTEMADHWLPTVAALIIMDSNQPKSHMKLPFFYIARFIAVSHKFVNCFINNFELCESGLFNTK